MKCPYCQSEKNDISETRIVEKTNSKIRIRYCKDCEETFYTEEVIINSARFLDLKEFVNMERRNKRILKGS